MPKWHVDADVLTRLLAERDWVGDICRRLIPTSSRALYSNANNFHCPSKIRNSKIGHLLVSPLKNCIFYWQCGEDSEGVIRLSHLDHVMMLLPGKVNALMLDSTWVVFNTAEAICMLTIAQERWPTKDNWSKRGECGVKRRSCFSLFFHPVIKVPFLILLMNS